MAEAVWYCQHCKSVVQPRDVTYEETHDVRAGGCGQSVVSLAVPSRPVRSQDYFIGRNGEAFDWMYMSLGGKVVEVKATLVREMLEALEAVDAALRKWLPAMPIGDYYRAWDKVQAALRKARGEEASS